MATMPKSQRIPVEYHEYDADAQLLTGNLLRPVERKIDSQAFISLEGKRDRHFHEHAEPFSLDGLISFGSGYTRVSGSHSEKHGWVTLATAVVKDLNILDVITADRIVAQVSTEHPPYDGHIPSVTFVGTRFENLRVGGHLIQLDLDLGICGDKPANDRPYLEDTHFLDRVQWQSNAVASVSALSAAPVGLYHKDELKHVEEARKRRAPYGEGYKATVKCSLVKSATAVPGANTYGNVLEIPGFGSVTLAKVEVEQTGTKTPTDNVTTYFDLTMLDIKMGSIGEGSIQVANVGANGKTRP